MQGILDGLMRCRNQRTCPHGRPIATVTTERELAAAFRRDWGAPASARRREVSKGEEIDGGEAPLRDNVEVDR